MSVYLPLGAGVFLFGLMYRLIGVGFAPIGGQLPEQKNVLRAADAHLGTVLALLRPAQPVRLVVLPHHIRDHRNHTEIGKAVLHIVPDAHGVERLHGGHSHAGGIAEQHPILDVAAEHAPRLQHPQQVRTEIVHLLKEPAGILVVAEVVIAGGVFVMVGKRDGGQDHVHAVFGHPCRFLHAVVIHQRVIFAFHFHALHSYASGHALRLGGTAQAVFLHDLPHLALQVLVLLPFLHQHTVNGIFRRRVNNVDHHLLRLEKAIDTVYRLNKIVKFIVDTDENRPVAMALEVAPAAAQALFGGKQPAAALREVDHPLLPFGIVHAAVDVHGVRQSLTNGVPLRLQIVPENEVRFRITVHDLFRHGHALVNALPLLP